MKITAKLKSAIEKSEMTRHEICKKVKCSRNHLYCVMTGKRDISKKLSDKLFKLLEVNYPTTKDGWASKERKCEH